MGPAKPGGEERRDAGASPVAVHMIAHGLHRRVIRRFEKLVREAPADHDVFLAFDATAVDPSGRRRARDLFGERLRLFRPPDVLDVAYPDPWADRSRPRLMPGNLDLLYLHLARGRPGYRRHWIVESDVVFTGHWSSILATFRGSGADVLGTTLHPYQTRPGWYWWPSFRPPVDVDRGRWLRGFFPLVRFSDDALEALNAAYRGGWTGHAEAVIPTVARHHGLELEDIGGDGPFVEQGHRNRFYTNTPERERLYPGTFVYRPTRPRAGLRPGTLWHPVKPGAGWMMPRLRLMRAWLAARLGRT